ncbi:chaB2 [Lambdina fiscellaria nucleopolyhedrovirus]|uniref:ChaB2 n=1 Tax=Lambdina fiscellaria nucleopolyhedrovirus TaxID=1642929 RepID=A0A0E3Z636_9ABAC|nr:chaB2 [Lambdina fiscellaria nucleopolyhedrovirus]AKC91712.1 chaB2 [Lambdina fiscellaria nucleopolyhedrovirus]
MNFQNLPLSARQLPYNGKRIYIKFYNKTLKMCRFDEAAHNVAWTAVKRKYYKRKGQWVAFADANDYDTTDSEQEGDKLQQTNNAAVVCCNLLSKHNRLRKNVYKQVCDNDKNHNDDDDEAEPVGYYKKYKVLNGYRQRCSYDDDETNDDDDDDYYKHETDIDTDKNTDDDDV